MLHALNDDDDDDDVVVNDDWWWWCWCMGDRYKASPLSSLGVSQALVTYFFLFSNKLLVKIIWEWPPLFSLIGFSIGCNFEFDVKVHCDLPFIKHSFFLKLIFLLSQAWYIELLKQKYLWHSTKHFHNLFLPCCVTNPKNIKSVYLVLILTSLTKILFLKKPHGIEDFEYQESFVPYIKFDSFSKWLKDKLINLIPSNPKIFHFECTHQRKSHLIQEFPNIGEGKCSDINFIPT